jgi:hypothetical protein
MSDALPLPPRPNLEQYKKLARDFQAAIRSGDSGAVRQRAARWAETIIRLRGAQITDEIRRRIDGDAARIEQRWLRFQQTHERAGPWKLADAQLLIARSHGFASWPKFARHLEGLERADSTTARFEAAVDAVVGGDAAMLAALLGEHPDLVRARSMREHRSTLLHYISANGVEDFRQETPTNIVEIARLLLKCGADVNAESDAYGGGWTALGLTATSCHPENAGVQLALLELLIEHGAVVDGPNERSVVEACLQNGRGQAAEYLASLGARLSLEGAAGVGRLDVVKTCFQQDGSLKPPATQQQMRDGFAWACEFGRTNVVEFLLQRGANVNARLRHDGQTGLHWAAYSGHAETVKLLLERGAAVDTKDERYGGTQLGWALYGWEKSAARLGRESYYDVVRLLVRAGARAEPEWYQDTLDSRMRAALDGELPSGS